MEIKSTELALGPHAGLIIKEAKHPSLNGLKLVEVTHKRIEGFCARSVVSLAMDTVEVFELFKKEVRLVG